MYREHFGFSEPPFSLTPNPEFLFLSSHHQEALAHLLYGIENRAGFIELSGEVGTGKTTIIRTLFAQLDRETYRTALIFNPMISPVGLLQEVNREFGVKVKGSDPRVLLQALNTFLLQENGAGRTAVLVVDEAQNLSPEVLEQVRLISNLETEREKLIQIVLVGQPELRDLLDRRDLRQLRQRITVRHHLQPLSRGETGEYIRHRIRVAASGKEPVVFSPAAVRRVYAVSGGFPRLINAVCDRAILAAYTRGKGEVSATMAGQAAADIGRGGKNRRLLPVAAAVVLAVAVVLALVPAIRHTLGGNRAARLTGEQLRKELAQVPERETVTAATNAVLERWGVPATTGGDLVSVARERGLSVTDLSTDLATLARMDAPALLQLRLPGGKTRLVALTGLQGETAAIAPPVAGKSTLPVGELESLWDGRATILWKNFYGISPRLKPGEEGMAVIRLQNLLASAGYGNEGEKGRFDRKTAAALRAFQQAESLPVDGRPGERTLLLLYRRSGGFFPPGLKKGTTGAGMPRETESKL